MQFNNTSTIPEFRSIAQQIEEFATSLCPFIEKTLFLLFFGLLFGLAHYSLLIIGSSEAEWMIKYPSFMFSVWCIFNIIFNYMMSILVHPGTPTDIPIHLLLSINHKCRKCGVTKPPRSHHCSICNKCIIQMDHHCPWIGNCVGHHNRKYFTNFITYLSLGLGQMLFFVSITDQPMIYVLVLTLFVCLLLFSVYHWYIIVRGKTSLQVCWEDPRYTPSQSLSKNIEIVFGTSNIFLCLCPNISLLKSYGNQWTG